MKISINRSSFARNILAMNVAYRILIKILTRILLLLHAVFLKCSTVVEVKVRSRRIQKQAFKRCKNFDAVESVLLVKYPIHGFGCTLP